MRSATRWGAHDKGAATVVSPTYGRHHANLLNTSTSGRLKVFNEGHCRMCLRHRKIRPLTRHHLVPLEWFNHQKMEVRQIRNANANIIPLCRPCHDLVDSQLEEVRTPARRELRRSLWQPEIAFAIRLRGADWLQETYGFGHP